MSLKIDMTLDGKKYTTTLKQVEGQTDRSMKKIESSSGKATKAISAGLSKILIPLAAIGVSAALVTKAFGNMLTYGDKLGKLHTRLGVDVKELDKLRQAADLAGVSFDTVVRTMENTIRVVGQLASGITAETGPAADALRRLGLEAKSLMAMKPDEQFKEIGAALMDIKDSTERIELAKALRIPPEMLQMFTDLDIKLADRKSVV